MQVFYEDREIVVCQKDPGVLSQPSAKGGEADVIVSDESIEIILKDTGPGIANIEQAMQEGFSTAPDNIRSLGFGAGMGLPNMKRYTDYMQIDSVVGEGTTITMRVNF